MHLASLVCASLLGFILTGAAASNEAPPAFNLNVMSFNVRTSLANDSCPAGCWANRQGRVANITMKYKPDLLGTQETAVDQHAFFTEKLQYQYVGECAGECSFNERNAIYYRASRLQLLWTKTFALSDNIDLVGSNTWGLEYRRAAVVARFRDFWSGANICILNTHYDISRGQEKSSELVASLLQKHCEQNDVVFMTGDLNHRPEGPAVQYLLGKHLINGKRTPIPLFEALTRAGKPGYTWIGNTFQGSPSGIKFDYIFGKDGPGMCLQSGTIITDLFGLYSSSDHTPVQCSFCLGAGCTNCLV